MRQNYHKKKISHWLFSAGLMGGLFAGLLGWMLLESRPIQAATAQAESPILLQPSVTEDKSSEPVMTTGVESQSQVTSTPTVLFIPTIRHNYPGPNPFGVEVAFNSLARAPALPKVEELGVGWVRMNNRISWRKLQPTEGGSIQWETLESFGNEVRALNQAGIKPIVTVDEYPEWAVQTRKDGQPSLCGPIREDKLDAFASFMRDLVKHYKTAEFNVKNWEMGNEPDIDPNIFPNNDSMYGCWGDLSDLDFYGGRHYGEMLKRVSTAVKAEDPSAQIWIGGLLLDSPVTTEALYGKPEGFFRGILEAGAGPHIDVVAFHGYSYYNNQVEDQDIAHPKWGSLGGVTLGKARYLRGIMAEYGVNKPVFLDEISLMCHESNTTFCATPDDNFFQAQANYAVRSTVRGLSEDIMGFTWFTMDYNNWRHTSLLGENWTPRPPYTAYQQLIKNLKGASYVQPVNYGEAVEAYAFDRADNRIQVIWAKTDTALNISIPQAGFVAAYTRDGTSITPTANGSNYVIPIGFSPVYILTSR